jgi:hypothetical protein
MTASKATGRTSRAQWLKKAKLGLMVHYLPHVGDRQLRTEPDWNTCVNGFDVDKFCDTAVEIGSGWIIFPFGQNCGPYCSPNPVVTRLAGNQWVTERDLFGELTAAAKKRNLAMIAYLPSEMWSREPELQRAMGWNEASFDKSAFQKNWREVIRHWGERFGADLAGWWYDGCYDATKKGFIPDGKNNWDNSRFDEERWFEAARAGNPARSVAMCAGNETFKLLFENQEDYLSGETGALLPPPENLPDHVLPHALTWLECFWMHTETAYDPEKRTGVIPPPRFEVQDVRDWLDLYDARGGGCTINIGIYRDGSLPEPSLDFLRKLRE